MNLARRAAVLAASLSFAFATPAFAQNSWPMDMGDFVEMSGITIDDGHTLDYLNHLTGLWKRGQDFAKAQGWITGYEVLMNVNGRKGEPDVYLITRSSRMVDAAEQQKRDDAYNAHMQRTIAQLETESGERAKYRHLAGSILLRELRFKK